MNLRKARSSRVRPHRAVERQLGTPPRSDHRRQSLQSSASDVHTTSCQQMTSQIRRAKAVQRTILIEIINLLVSTRFLISSITRKTILDLFSSDPPNLSVRLLTRLERNWDKRYPWAASTCHVDNYPSVHMPMVFSTCWR
jgi:hypothetical protein